jgi:hypothetical protein
MTGFVNLSLSSQDEMWESLSGDPYSTAVNRVLNPGYETLTESIKMRTGVTVFSSHGGDCLLRYDVLQCGPSLPSSGPKNGLKHSYCNFIAKECYHSLVLNINKSN